MYIPKSLVVRNFLSHKNTSYTFVQGKPVLIVGKNNSNQGQASNGSGKSTFNEAIAVVIKGDPLRDMKLKEMIFDGEDQSTIIWTLNNNITGDDLVIERNIYLKKPSDCKITLGDEQIVKPNVGDYKKWILDEFGFSEEDFFNFYLLTLENAYKPFFSLTDTPKKAIINRFSGANRVDDVFPHIDADLKVKQESLIKIQSRKLVLESKQEMIKELLSEAQNFDGQEARKASLKLLDDDVDEFERSLESKSEIIKELKEEAAEIEKAINELIKTEPDFKGDREKLQLSLTNLTTEIEKLEASQNKFQTEKKAALKEIEDLEDKEEAKKKSSLKEIDDCEKEISSTKQKYQLSITKIKGDKANLENQMAESIECPKCKHIFSTKDKDFDAVKVEKEITALEARLKKAAEVLKEQEDELFELGSLRTEVIDAGKTELSKLDLLKQSTNQEFTTKTADIRRNLEECNSKVTTINAQLRKLQEDENVHFRKLSQQRSSLETKSNEIEVKKQQVASLKQSIKDKKQEIEELKGKPLPDQKDKQDEYKKQLQEVETELTLVINEVLEAEKAVLDLDTWTNNFKSFKSFLANKSIKNIENHTNLFLQEMKTDLSVEVEGYRILSNKKLKEEISTSILRDGMNGKPYGRFSRGERARIDLASIIAMQELVNINAKNGLDLLIIDEILDCCDALGIELLFQGLHHLEKTVLIISQNNVKALKEDTLTFIKETSGETSIVLSEDLIEEEMQLSE